MALDTKYITTLADGIKFYFEISELMELSAAFNVDLPSRSNSGVPYVAWARYLVEKTEHGNNRRFLQTLLASLVSRGREGVASTNYEKREHHQSMVNLLSQLETELQVGDIPSELSVPESSPFTAKSESREFFEKAETEITIVDNWVGIGTLDCLRNITQHVELSQVNRRVALVWA